MWIVLMAFAQLAAPAFSTIAQGRNSGIAEPRQVVVRTAVEWETLWRAHGGRETPPPVDFRTQVVAAVFLGTRPTGGYSVDVVAVRREAAGVVVEYAERSPAPDALVTQALTSPFHLVSVGTREESVRFRRVDPRSRAQD